MNAGSIAILPRQILPEEAAALMSGEPDGELTAALRRDLLDGFADGPRAMLFRGLDPDVMGEPAFARALLAMGSWLGSAAIQSPEAELVARVEHSAGEPQARGTHSDDELQAHTDLHDILALACVRPARHGGDSFLVDASELYERLAQDHPDCLTPLQAGYYFGTNPVLQSLHRVSGEPVPVLFDLPQRKLVCWNGYFMRMAAQARGEAIPAALSEAIERLRQVAAELGRARTFRLEAGDVLFWHNWSWLHGRTAFQDEGHRRRRLLRLWLRSDLVARPPILAQRGAWIDADHRLTQTLGYREQ